MFGSEFSRNGIHHVTNASGPWTEEEITHPPEEGLDFVGWAGIDNDGSIWVSFVRWSFYNPCGFICPRPRSRFDAIYVINNVGGAWSDPLSLPEQLGRNLAIDVHDGALHVAYGMYDEASGVSSIHYASNRLGDWEFLDVGVGHGPHIALGSNGSPWFAFRSDDGTGSLAFAHEGGYMSVLIPGVLGEESTVHELLIDPSDRQVVVFDLWEDDPGRYRSYAVVRESPNWLAPEPIADRYLGAAALSPTGAVHALFDIFNSDDISEEGMWYASLTDGVAETRQLNQSVRFAFDAPSPPEDIVVDALGRPHVFYSTAYDDGEEGLWYMAGPPL